MTKSQEIKNIIGNYSEDELIVVDNLTYGKEVGEKLNIVRMFDLTKKSSGKFAWKRIVKRLKKETEPSVKEKYARWMMGDGAHPFGEDID